MKKGKDSFFISLTILLILFVFTVGLFIPLGIAAAVPYAFIVMFTLWVSGTKFTYIVGILTSILTIASIFLVHDIIAVWAVVVANRIISIFGIWIAVIFVLRQKVLEVSKKRNKDELDALFQHAVEGMLIANQKGEIILLNPAVEKIFGYKKVELIGQKIEILLPERFSKTHVSNREQFIKSPHARPMGDGKLLFARKKEGGEFPVEISLSYFVTKEGTFAIAFIVDVTERKEKEDAILIAKNELDKYSKSLEISNRDLEQFAYVASHDLQEPLRKIQSFGERLKTKEINNLSEQGQDYINRMGNAASRMQNLINDLLMFSRITKTNQEFIKVDLNEILTGVLSDLEVTIEKHQVKIEAGNLLTIDANPIQMRQVFQNLISNAIKFRKDEFPIVKIYANKLDENSVQIFFEDNGIGFDEQYLDKIFTIFQRLEGQKHEGSGIGLAVCKKIANGHGGDITAKSQIGQGSTFIITLAIHQKNVQF